MKYFLIVYDRSVGRLLEPVRQFDKSAHAMEALVEMEKKYLGNKDAEAMALWSNDPTNIYSFNEPKNGICPFCDRETDCVAGDPGKWPLVFTLPDGTGKAQRFHVRCVTDRLFQRTEAHEEQIANWRSEGKIAAKD